MTVSLRSELYRSTVELDRIELGDRAAFFDGSDNERAIASRVSDARCLANRKCWGSESYLALALDLASRKGRGAA